MVSDDRENIRRLRGGWFPRRDARWYWWVIADAMVLAGVVRRWAERKVRRRR